MKKISAKQKRILAEIDQKLTVANKDFFATKEAKEAEYGFPLVPPTEVRWEDLRGTSSDLSDLQEAGLIRKRITSHGTMVKRTNLPSDYYFPGKPLVEIL